MYIYIYIQYIQYINLVFNFLLFSPTVWISIVLPVKILYHLSIFSNTAELSQSRVRYLPCDQHEMFWLIIMEHDDIDDESVIFDRVFVHREIIKTGIWVG